MFGGLGSGTGKLGGLGSGTGENCPMSTQLPGECNRHVCVTTGGGYQYREAVLNLAGFAGV